MRWTRDLVIIKSKIKKPRNILEKRKLVNIIKWKQNWIIDRTGKKASSLVKALNYLHVICRALYQMTLEFVMEYRISQAFKYDFLKFLSQIERKPFVKHYIKFYIP